MKRTLVTLVCIIFASALMLGCDSGSANPPGYTKADFAKTPPPADYLKNIPKPPGAPPAAAAGPPKGATK
jgi:hypothetical protein